MSKPIPYRYRILVFLFFLTFITYLDRICFSLVGVRIKSEFNLSHTEYGWILAAFSLAYAIFEVPSGMLGDRIGQRAVLIRIVLWWSLFTFLTGFTTGFVSLLIVRFLFGVGESGAFPNSGGVVARWFPANEISKGVSWIMIGSNIGAAVAPFIVVPIAAAHGWRMSFYVNGFIGLLWVFVCIFWFRNNPSEKKSVPDDEKHFIESNRRIDSHSGGMSWSKLLRSRSVWGLLISYYTTQWALYFFVGWMSVYLQEGRHLSEDNMKVATTWLFIMGAVGAFVAGFVIDWLVKRNGLRTGRRLGGMIAIGGMSLTFLIAASTANNTIAVSCFVVGNFFVWNSVVCAVSTCIDIAGRNSATLYGLMNFVGQIGAFFLAATFGKIVDVTHNYDAPLYLTGTLLIVGALAWLMIKSDKPLFESANVISH